ncbi:MAG: hypothetical protein JKY65_21460 [Planctomycetes bacterium]|nr:hypothetical protein [Planctomycetota bacterium]
MIVTLAPIAASLGGALVWELSRSPLLSWIALGILLAVFVGVGEAIRRRAAVGSVSVTWTPEVLELHFSRRRIHLHPREIRWVEATRTGLRLDRAGGRPPINVRGLNSEQAAELRAALGIGAFPIACAAQAVTLPQPAPSEMSLAFSSHFAGEEPLPFVPYVSQPIEAKDLSCALALCEPTALHSRRQGRSIASLFLAVSGGGVGVALALKGMPEPGLYLGIT